MKYGNIVELQVQNDMGEFPRLWGTLLASPM